MIVDLGVAAPQREWHTELPSLAHMGAPEDEDGRSVPEPAAGAGGPAADPEATADLFRSWGHLRVMEKLGEGSFGEVYRAYDPLLDRQVALKLSKHDFGPEGQ